MPNALRLLSSPRLLFYKTHSWVHSAPRVREAEAAVTRLQELQIPIRRIVDYGCGLGDLLDIAANRGLSYLGLDVDEEALSHCRRMHGESDFRRFSTLNGSSPPAFETGDVVILNGVAHHLSDALLSTVLPSFKAASALIILDHVQVGRIEGPFSLVQHTLQSLDKGKFVRPYEAFTTFKDFETVQRREFMIRFLGVPLWPYFCHIYRPVPPCASS